MVKNHIKTYVFWRIPYFPYDFVWCLRIRKKLNSFFYIETSATCLFVNASYVNISKYLVVLIISGRVLFIRATPRTQNGHVLCFLLPSYAHSSFV